MNTDSWMVRAIKYNDVQLNLDFWQTPLMHKNIDISITSIVIVPLFAVASKTSYWKCRNLGLQLAKL